MPKVSQNSFLRRMLRPMPLILIASVLCFGGWFALGSGGLWDMYSLRQRYRRQQTQIADLKARRDYLKQYLADLKDKDDLALQQAARDHGLVAKGETIYEIKVEPEKK